MNESIYLGGGCFWCLEAIYLRLKGVLAVQSGYMGGHVINPSYKQVCNGDSGHVEIIKIEFDPNQVSLPEILQYFFITHDPTTMNRQGDDIGEQYKSVIFYQDDVQKNLANQVIKQLQPDFNNKIITAVIKASKFYVAEDYHQDYYRRNPNQPYCMFVIAKKLTKLKLNA